MRLRKSLSLSGSYEREIVTNIKNYYLLFAMICLSHYYRRLYTTVNSLVDARRVSLSAVLLTRDESLWRKSKQKHSLQLDCLATEQQKTEPFLGEGENLNSIKAMLAKNSWLLRTGCWSQCTVNEIEKDLLVLEDNFKFLFLKFFSYLLIEVEKRNIFSISKTCWKETK